MSGYRCFGIWYCPRLSCMVKREFITYDNAVTDPDFAECVSCGYQYGKCVDETHEDPAQRVKNRLDRDVVRKGYQEYLEKMRVRMRSAGLEHGGLGDKVRHEYKRRMGLL